MPKNLKHIILALPALVIAFTAVTVVPAFAVSGRDDTRVESTDDSGSGGDSSDSSSSSDDSTDSSGSEAEIRNESEIRGRETESRGSESENEVEIHSSISDDRRTELSGRGAALLEDRQNENKENRVKLTAAARTKKCELRKQGLTNKFANIAGNGQRFQTKINGILANAETYRAKNAGVTVANYDALLVTAKTAQAKSSSSIAALKAVSVSLNCNNVSVAGDVATVKAAAEQVRTDLKSYKSAVKAVLHALRDAKVSSSTSTTNSTTKTSGDN